MVAFNAFSFSCTYGSWSGSRRPAEPLNESLKANRASALTPQARPAVFTSPPVLSALSEK